MGREVVIGDCRLILGDAMEILPSLPRADLCVSDVPYKLTTGGVSKSSKTMSGIFAAHNYRNDGQLVMATVPFPQMMMALYASLVDDADCYVMANDKNVHPLTDALDPFMGSGTTGVACAHLRRKFVGIELHEPFFDMAVDRIRAAYERPDMFAEAAV